MLDGHLMAAPVSSGQSLAVGTPGRLFDLPSETYAVHPDGKFLIMVPTTPASYSVRVIDNW